MPSKNKPTGGLRVHTIKSRRSASRIGKAIHDTGERAAASGTDDESQDWLKPPVSFAACYWLHENSSALRPCIDVYKTNIDGFGHHFPEKYTENEIKTAIQDDAARGPAEEEESKTAEEKLKKTWRTEIIKSDDGAVQWDATVQARYRELRQDIDREHAELNHFFEYACPGKSFAGLRMDTREDCEVTGNAFWEVVRSNITGRPAKIYPATAKNIRLCPAGEPVDVVTKEQVNALDYRIVHIMRRMRMYRQETEAGTAIVYFKEFGDTRCVSALTGTPYKNRAELQSAEGGGGGVVPEATELIHFKIHSGSSPYGIPRWFGAYKLIKGLIEKDQVDLDYYTDNTIPPGYWEVVGHSQLLDEGMVEVLERTMKDAKERGSGSQHETPIIEATSEIGSTLVPRVIFHNLMDARLKEATHLKYAEMCKEYIRQMFRLSKFLLGDAADVNRSTSVSVLEMAEMQIFSAERNAMDFWMNHVFFSELNIRYHKFRSMGPQMEDLESVATSLEKLVKSWLVTPAEGRRHITDNTTLDLEDVDEEWARRPPEATMSGRGYTPEGDSGEGGPGAVAEFEREADEE